MKETLTLRGRVRLTARDPKTGKIVYRSKWLDNLIVTAGKALVCRILMDDGGYDTGLTWCAIGTGTDAPALGDTALQTEVFRLAVATKTRSGNVIVYSTAMTAAQSTFAIKEAALYGHSTAGAGADSGELFARVAMDYDNSGGNYDITIDWQLTVG